MNVFITGASSGIGKALAQYYASQGATLGLVARRGELLAEIAATLPSTHAVYAADVRDEQAMQAAAQDFMRRYGTPDIVIANAGVSNGTLSNQPSDNLAFKAIFDINVLGMVHTFQPFISAMQAKRKSCTLVGIASIAGIRGLPGAGAYSASKAAAINLLESMRVELKDAGIAVVTIAPGYIRTPMTDVNPYNMPFILDADIAAERMAKVIEQKRRFAVVPWQMGVIARIMRLLPAWLWDWALRNAPRKLHAEWDWL